jgi:hypothetical protein
VVDDGATKPRLPAIPTKQASATSSTGDNPVAWASVRECPLKPAVVVPAVTGCAVQAEVLFIGG